MAQSQFTDYDILKQVAALLKSTSAFDLVSDGGLPEESGSSAERVRAAYLDLVAWAEETWGDNTAGQATTRTVRFNVVLAVRMSDQGALLAELSRLSGVVCNAINGQSLGGETFLAKTMIRAGAFSPRMSGERRLKLSGVWFQAFDDNTSHKTAKT